MSTHPDLLELDALRAGEAPAEVKDHVSACTACRSVVDDLRLLSARLQESVSDPLRIPPEIDRAILARTRPRRLRVAPFAAAAAVLLASALFLTLPAGRNPADLDLSGQVDILDAYLLARILKEGKAPTSSWDQTGDGSVDHGDVAVIARASVSLHRRTP